MVRTLPTLIVALAALSATPASAQLGFADSATNLRVQALDGFVEKDTVASLQIDVLYHYTVVGVALGPTQVDLEIAAAPDWLVATLSPSTLSLPVYSGAPSASTTQSSIATSKLLLTLGPGAPPDARDVVSVRALAHPNGNIKGSVAEESVLVATDGTMACEPAAAVVSEAAAPEKTDKLETRTLGAAPAAPPLALAASGLVGAAAGGGVAWRLKRRG